MLCQGCKVGVGCSRSSDLRLSSIQTNSAVSPGEAEHDLYLDVNGTRVHVRGFVISGTRIIFRIGPQAGSVVLKEFSVVPAAIPNVNRLREPWYLADRTRVPLELPKTISDDAVLEVRSDDPIVSRSGPCRFRIVFPAGGGDSVLAAEGRGEGGRCRPIYFPPGWGTVLDFIRGEEDQ
jgi:hypothetical protein